MSTTVKRTSSKSGRQSLLFHDLATPVSAHRGRFTSPGQAAVVSALWRENFGGADPPPPPVFTLEDRQDFSPESGIGEYPLSPEFKSETRTPRKGSLSPLKTKTDATTPFAILDEQKAQQSPVTWGWWSPLKNSNDRDEKGKSSLADGAVQPGALITLPPPREVARPDLPRNCMPMDNLGEEEWVTVIGFSPGDTNLILCEFEKCGVILKHIPGPRDANWMHILYQNRFDAQKALSKNGTQINGVLIVGVKPLDPIQRQCLNEKLNNQGFMLLPPQSSGSSFVANPLPRQYYLQNDDGT